ncbi:MAG TPA: HD domain-containing phosphohydrolase [Alphaproteobacteria bacterium]|jgi:HD-GYP domain-containing protein (c-di-GMP phosphodiesterase class II)/HAMP domain-containing protein
MFEAQSGGGSRDAVREPWRLSLRWHISSIFVCLLIASLLTTSVYSIVQSHRIIENASSNVYDGILRGVGQQIGQISAPARAVVNLVAADEIVAAEDTAARLRRIGLLGAALSQNARISAIYVGYGNGDFFILRKTVDGASRASFGAPDNAAYVVQAIERAPDGARSNLMIFLDDGLQEVGRAPDAGYDLDPRERDWFKRALAANETIETDPYLFYATNEAGTTFARRSPDGGAVVGADLTLQDISAALAALTPTASAELMLFTGDRKIVASNRPDFLQAAATAADAPARLPSLDEAGQAELWEPRVIAAAGDKLFIAARSQGRDWRVSVGRVANDDDLPTYLGIAVPTEELLSDADRIQRTLIWVSAAILAAALIVAWLLAHRVSRPLRRLADQARAIEDFDFSDAPAIRSRILEVHELSHAIQAMRMTIRRFLKIGRALVRERDFAPLLDRILAEMIDVTQATGAIFYLREEKEDYLRRHLVRRRSGAAPADIPGGRQRVSMHDDGTVIGLVSRQRSLIHRHVKRADLDPAGEAVVSHLGLAGDEFESITIPLLDRRSEILGVVLLVTEAATDTTAADSSKRLMALVSAIAGSAAIAMENSQLLLAQRRLLDGLIELIAGSIDTKSSYAGGHCQRVPVLAQMLAEAACQATDGPFADFEIDADQREALRIGSWLHDCGKITTPEYVVDKATKLETIYNRIHEVRTRFEVVKREFEIAALRGRLAGQDIAEVERDVAAFNAEADADFAFVAECNVGDEFMAPERVERLKRVAERRWVRTLDDRLGLSHEEFQRANRTPSPALPVMERLLDDRPEHIVTRAPSEVMPEDNPWGFKLRAPAHRYNMGELYNLSVGYGTLTEEERYKINDHIVQTIVMLESLPFPRQLAAVPEIAGGHHERMDGGGYPKRRMAGEMSVLARIMAVADVFEALTACDRPYKKAKSVSESVRILGSFKKNGHLDPDLVDLFLKSGAWKAYADRFLDAGQIDQPDIEAVLAIQAPAFEGGASATPA